MGLKSPVVDFRNNFEVTTVRHVMIEAMFGLRRLLTFLILIAVFGEMADVLVGAQELTNLQRIELYRKIRRCTVKVFSTQDGQSYWLGTGVGFRRFGNYAVVVTNAHVTENENMTTRRCTVRPYGASADERLPAAYLYSALDDSRSIDVAFLVIYDPMQRIGVAPVAPESAKDPSVVYACGHPRGEDFLIDDGKIVEPNAKPSSVSKVSGLITATLWILAHDALTEHGNSGGGLFNARGELVGINTWLRRDGMTGLAIRAWKFEKMFRLASATVWAHTDRWQETSIEQEMNEFSRILALGSWSYGSQSCTSDGVGQDDDHDSRKYDDRFSYACLLGKAECHVPTKKGMQVFKVGLAKNRDTRFVHNTHDIWIVLDSYKNLAIPNLRGRYSFRINDTKVSDNYGSLTVIALLGDWYR